MADKPPENDKNTLYISMGGYLMDCRESFRDIRDQIKAHFPRASWDDITITVELFQEEGCGCHPSIRDYTSYIVASCYNHEPDSNKVKEIDDG